MIEKPVIKQIVELANCAPSGDNCQPWRFNWDGETLKVFHDDRRARHFLNPLNLASLLTLGTLWECLVLAARSRGYQAAVNLQPEAGVESTAPWLIVTFSPAAANDHSLEIKIRQRHTDRRPFKKQLDPGMRQQLIRDGKDQVSDLPVGVHFLEGKPKRDWVKLLCDLEGLIFAHPEAHRDFYQWVTAENSATGSGMPMSTLGLSAFEFPMIKMCRNFAIQRLVNGLGGGMFVSLRNQQLVKSSAFYGLITLKSDRTPDVVSAGQAFMRHWLMINHAGLAFQPLSLGSINCYLIGKLPSFFVPSERLEHMFHLHARDFNLPRGEAPIWLYRAGLPRSNSQVSRSPRLPVDSILTYSP